MASDGIESKMSGTNLRPGTVREIVDDTATNLIELSGVIKWFDVAKGFGFIIPDNGMPDVLLHVTCLRRDGYQTAYEGARVICEVLQRSKGLQAFRIVSMDESTAVHPAQMPPPRTHVTVTPTSGAVTARNLGYNNLINPGQSTGMGFNANHTGNTGRPASFTWRARAARRMPRSLRTRSPGSPPRRAPWPGSCMRRA